MNSNEVLKLLEWSGAIMMGHFKLTSGRHSDKYIEKFRLLENPIALDKICSTMAEKFTLSEDETNLVVGAAIGGILLAGGIGRYLNLKHIFSERVDGKMIFKRGFSIEKNSNIVIVEDIITTGGSVFELIKVAEDNGAKIIGIVSLIHRSEEEIDFGYKYKTLLEFPVKSWNENEVPKWLADIPITKPGRTGKK